MEQEYWILDGILADPVSGTLERGDLLIRGGVIEKKVKRGENLTEKQVRELSCRGEETGPAGNRFVRRDNGTLERIEAKGLIVAPGLMDAHVHFRDPGQTWKEDIMTGSAAAAKGGFTRVVCMANTKPVIDEPSVLLENLEKGSRTGIHMYQAAAVTRGLRGTQLTDMEALAECGAAGFTDDGIPILDEKILLQAMAKAAELDLPVSLHEEDPLFIKQPGVHEGKVSAALGYGGAGRMAEEIMTARDCMLALHTGASVCIQHISSARSVELVRLARQMGADIHAEATPHHFTLTEEAVLKYGTNARMNPPLRTEEDREAIIEGLADGTIDMIVTDHAPHSREEKAAALDKAPSGIIGLETSLGLAVKSLVLPGQLSLIETLRRMSTNPALFYRQKPGRVEEGEAADLVLFGLTETWKADHFVSRSSNSPFLGWELPAKIHATICGGSIVYHEYGEK